MLRTDIFCLSQYIWSDRRKNYWDNSANQPCHFGAACRFKWASTSKFHPYKKHWKKPNTFLCGCSLPKRNGSGRLGQTWPSPAVWCAQEWCTTGVEDSQWMITFNCGVQTIFYCCFSATCHQLDIFLISRHLSRSGPTSKAKMRELSHANWAIMFLT